MRPVEVLQSIGAVCYVIAIVMVATRRRIVRNLERAHAFDENTAIVVDTSRPWRGFMRKRLEADGVLRAVADGRYWLDREAWQHRRAARRRRGLTIAACIFLIGGLIVAVIILLERVQP